MVIASATAATARSASTFADVATSNLIIVAGADPLKEQPPTRWQVTNRLVRDAVKRILDQVTLSGLAVNLIADSLAINRDLYVQNWALAELRFTVSYDFQAATP